MLWEVKVSKDGKDITQLLCKNGNFINYKTDKYVIDSESSEFVYLPIERQPKLVRMEDDKIIDLPIQIWSTFRFIGNNFGFGLLVEIYNDQVLVTNLLSFFSLAISLGNGKRILWANMESSAILQIEYREIEIIGKVEKTIDTKKTLFNITFPPAETTA